MTKTDREIELEKKLEIAVKALDKIGEVNTNKAIYSFQRCQMIAEEAIEKIKEIKGVKKIEKNLEDI